MKSIHFELTEMKSIHFEHTEIKSIHFELSPTEIKSIRLERTQHINPVAKYLNLACNRLHDTLQ